MRQHGGSGQLLGKEGKAELLSKVAQGSDANGLRLAGRTEAENKERWRERGLYSDLNIRRTGHTFL